MEGRFAAHRGQLFSQPLHVREAVVSFLNPTLGCHRACMARTEPLVGYCTDRFAYTADLDIVESMHALRFEAGMEHAFDTSLTPVRMAWQVQQRAVLPAGGRPQRSGKHHKQSHCNVTGVEVPHCKLHVSLSVHGRSVPQGSYSLQDVLHSGPQESCNASRNQAGTCACLCESAVKYATYKLIPSAAQESWKMTRNQDLNVLHVNNAKAFAAGVDARVVTGDTLIFDFIYFLHPVRGSRLFQPVVLHGCVCGNGMLPVQPARISSHVRQSLGRIGHWCEMMLPLYMSYSQSASQLI